MRVLSNVSSLSKMSTAHSSLKTWPAASRHSCQCHGKGRSRRSGVELGRQHLGDHWDGQGQQCHGQVKKPVFPQSQHVKISPGFFLCYKYCIQQKDDKTVIWNLSNHQPPINLNTNEFPAPIPLTSPGTIEAMASVTLSKDLLELVKSQGGLNTFGVALCLPSLYAFATCCGC